LSDVEGSVRKAGNRIRVTAQLVEAGAGNHVWAERYDRDLADIFAMQDEITERCGPPLFYRIIRELALTYSVYVCRAAHV